MIWFFAGAIVFCAYTYLGFPLLLHFFAKRATPACAQPIECEESAACRLPTVSIVIAAHNEADNLTVKISSLEKLDYPTEKLQCVFVSDGSTDDTVKVLQEACEYHDTWQEYHYAEAAGKPTAVNLGVTHASGEIIVFMDARQRVGPAAIQALVSRFADPSVGAVSGELMLESGRGGEASSVSLYWRYEKWIRENESRLFSTTGATGALYAIRRADYQPLPSDALLDDFDTPISLLRQGKRTVFEPAAQLFDQAEPDTAREFNRKARTLAGNYQSFSRHRWLFDPKKNPVWWQFISHKVFRLLVPYALGIAFVASLLGHGAFLQMMLAVQACFYGVGLLSFLGVQSRMIGVVRVFLHLNAAAVVGAWRAWRGSSAVHWKSTA